jgi:hypothetical protein
VVLGAVGGQDAPQPVAPTAAGNPAERPVHCAQVEDAADLSLVDRSRKPGFGKHFSKVHQRARHARDRDGFLHGASSASTVREVCTRMSARAFRERAAVTSILLWEGTGSDHRPAAER